MQWMLDHYKDLAALAFAVVTGFTVIVEAIGKLSQGKKVTWLLGKLHWLHDKLSPFAMGNQDQLHQPMPVDETNPYPPA